MVWKERASNRGLVSLLRNSLLVLNFARLVESFLIIFSVVTLLLVTVLLVAWLLHLFARVYRKRGHQSGDTARQGSRPQVGTTYTQEKHKENKQTYIHDFCPFCPLVYTLYDIKQNLSTYRRIVFIVFMYCHDMSGDV